MKKLTTVSMISSVINKHLDKGGVVGKAKAGKSGNLFESVIYALEGIGFSVCRSCKDRDHAPLFDEGTESGNRIKCNVSYDSILKQTARRKGLKTRNGTPRTEFVLEATNIKTTKEFPNVVPGQENKIRVECKYQNSPGTTEFKLLHSYLDLQYGATETNIIMLVDGKGFTPTMIAFMREVCEENTVIWTKAVKQSRKNIVFMDIDGFIDWANRAFV